MGGLDGVGHNQAAGMGGVSNFGDEGIKDGVVNLRFGGVFGGNIAPCSNTSHNSLAGGNAYHNQILGGASSNNN